MNTDEQLFNQAVAFQRAGQKAEAHAILTDLNRKNPNNGYVWGTLGVVESSLGRIAEALEAMKNAYALDPATEIWKQELGMLLVVVGDLDGAESLTRGPSISSAIIKAKVLEAKGKYSEATEILEAVISEPPPGIYDGRALPVESQLSVAKMLYAQCCRRLGDPLKGIYVLSRPNVVPSTPPHMLGETLLQNCGLLFERGHCFDAMGEYAAAWDCFLAANRSQNVLFDRESFKGQMRRVMEGPIGQTHTGKGGERLIFIVGIPRSGTSLTEQILGRHSQVTPMGERDAMFIMGKKLDARGWPDLSPEEIEEFANLYMEGCPEEGYVTDKMPGNWYHTGLIRQIFPKAQIVHCIRDAQDCLVSCFMQLFSHMGMSFTNSFEGLSLYYELWKSYEVGGLELSYEELVSHPDAAIPQLLEGLGLPFEEACLQPHKATRHVATASYAQVKQPIHSRSIGRGAPYAKYLPFKKETP